ncbi:WD40 repeat-like protein [Sistotremastrum suecicum HHB10207 ss-3]|uniref:WD40 repeat-like protein n=1 Tax=Sistotremastrum suecicum HHB10207 ss-3 TaxID=1314776 RepID=A0A166I151_9AGAM|nr:WD40 repeat-like protein [Sistotremastrum suecicum HHB10207 ss-3]
MSSSASQSTQPAQPAQNVRVRTLEIRWHDSKPITTCDFQPRAFKKNRTPADYATESYKLATGGEDNSIRVWMVHPNILPPSLAATSGDATAAPAPHPPRIEYLSTLSRHTAPVNVVRWSPNGELIASAGDDGMVIIWAPSSNPSTSFGAESADDVQYEKEFWKPRLTLPCTTMQVYDLAWSPTGEYVLTGSTDNTARVFSVADGKCVREITEHNHYVQGVAWDPMNEYIATQSSDRSVHVYSISTKQGIFEAHAIGKNTRLSVRHARTPSVGRPRMFRRESTASDSESAISEVKEDAPLPAPMPMGPGQLTPTASIASTPSMFPPPQFEVPSSRRSSFSSNAPGSPALSSRYARSPSPMPPLPAIRPPSSPALWAQVKMYGDENFTNFFRRLTFSPDGGLLMTPAGQFEDPSVIPRLTGNKGEEAPSRGRKSKSEADPTSQSSVYIYSRLNFARPPIGQIPGFKKASVAVKFSPLLYELRNTAAVDSTKPDLKPILVERGKQVDATADVAGPAPKSKTESEPSSTPVSPRKSIPPLPSPAPSTAASETFRAPTPTPPSNNNAGTVFALPYRMMFAVATMDTVTIHDTQQAGPICLFTKLHYDEFTDMSWSPDGQCLLLSSRDGYCTIVIFDEPIPLHSSQQHALQLQTIAQSHTQQSPVTHTAGVPLPFPSPAPSHAGSVPPLSSSSAGSNVVSLPKRPLTPALSDVSSVPDPSGSASDKKETSHSDTTVSEPVKKKRRVELTRVGDVTS